MKITREKSNGITLVALIVTIIILLILAGVSISSLTGNGLFEKTKLAEQKHEEAQAKENQEIQNTIDLIDGYLGDSSKITAESIEFIPDTSDTTINYDENWKMVKNVKEALDYLYNH